MTEKELLEFVQERSIINKTLRVGTRNEVFTGTAQEIGWGVLILRIERKRPGIHPSDTADVSYEQVAIDTGQIVSIAF